MIWIFLLLTLAILVQIYHWHWIFVRSADPGTPPPSPEYPPPLSVIICFHKTWEEIPAILKNIEAQSYSDFEVNLINDGPVTLHPAHLQWLSNHPRIHYHEHRKKNQGKKDALAFGIESARHEWLVFTDIDCTPGRDWLLSVIRHIPEQPGIILGYSPYLHQQGLLGFVIDQETLLTAVQYLGWAAKNHPYMGVGRNLIYHRYIYETVTFQSHLHLPSGDDDLFVNEAASLFPVNILTARESFVHSLPPVSWQEWRKQKSRHLSMGKFYSRKSKIRISIFSFSLGIEKILLLILLFSGHFQWFLFFLLTKIIFTSAPLRRIYKSLDQKNHFWKMWIYEWMHVFYLTLASPWIFIKTKKKWE